MGFLPFSCLSAVQPVRCVFPVSFEWKLRAWFLVVGKDLDILPTYCDANGIISGSF